MTTFRTLEDMVTSTSKRIYTEKKHYYGHDYYYYHHYDYVYNIWGYGDGKPVRGFLQKNITTATTINTTIIMTTFRTLEDLVKEDQ